MYKHTQAHVNFKEESKPKMYEGDSKIVYEPYYSRC
jgi:hypothetical protein